MRAVKREPFLPLWIAAIPLMVGLAMFLLTFFFGGSGSTEFIKILGYVLAVLATAITVIFLRHIQIYNSLQHLSKIVECSRLFTLMYESTKLSSGYARECEKMVQILSDAEAKRLRFPQINDVYEWKREQILTQFGRMAQGRVEINDPHKEIVTNGEFVEKFCKRELLAVSYNDRPFWEASEGDGFLDIQKTMIKRSKIKVARVFIIETGATLDQYRLIMQKQKDVGISVRYIHERDLPSTVKDSPQAYDIVIYDGELVRVGHSEIDPNDAFYTGKYKHATLLFDEVVIESWKTRFGALHHRSTPF